MEQIQQDSRNKLPLRKIVASIKVLGLMWQPTEDILAFAPDSVVEFAQRRTNTKRFVLETFARLCDPLSLVAPFLACEGIPTTLVRQDRLGRPVASHCR